MKNNTPITHIALVFDKSGSMGDPVALGDPIRAESLRNAAISGFNEQIQEIRENSKEQDIRVYVITFNASVYEHIWGEPASSLVEIAKEDYLPKGGTAFRDALGYTIQKLLDTTNPNESDNVAYLVKVISDGKTMNDTNYSVSQLRNLVNKVQNTGNWTISYMLGCDDSYLHEISRQTGVPLSNMAKWSNNNAEAAQIAFTASNANSRMYFKERSQGIKSSDTYMNKTLGVAADFTPEAQKPVYPGIGITPCLKPICVARKDCRYCAGTGISCDGEEATEFQIKESINK